MSWPHDINIAVSALHIMWYCMCYRAMDLSRLVICQLEPVVNLQMEMEWSDW